MAIFHISPATSVLKNDGTIAFVGDSSGLDTLIVDPGSYLVSANNGDGALLAATGAWMVNVNGSIVAQDQCGRYAALRVIAACGALHTRDGG